MICKCWDERFFFSDRFWNAIPQSSMIWCSPQAMILDRSANLSILQMLHLRSDLRKSTDPLVSSSSLQRPVDHPCIETLLEESRQSGRHIGEKVFFLLFLWFHFYLVNFLYFIYFCLFYIFVFIWYFFLKTKHFLFSIFLIFPYGVLESLS